MKIVLFSLRRPIITAVCFYGSVISHHISGDALVSVVLMVRFVQSLGDYRSSEALIEGSRGLRVAARNQPAAARTQRDRRDRCLGSTGAAPPGRGPPTPGRKLGSRRLCPKPVAKAQRKARARGPGQEAASEPPHDRSVIGLRSSSCNKLLVGRLAVAQRRHLASRTQTRACFRLHKLGLHVGHLQ